MPEMPEPSSMHVEVGDSQPDVKRMLVGEAIHSAKRGVTAQTTAQKVSGLPWTWLTSPIYTLQCVCIIPNKTSTRAMYQAQPRPFQSGALLWLLHTRTCARGSCLTIARQQTSALLDDQIHACNAELQGLGMRVDEAQRRAWDLLREDDKSLCATQ